ncbi:hypothetical protein OUZ56_008972 [Daphnia magna]|uniref:Uncharacterized protein n=1 Tax=Daphnia magna TaxID=35525 RepID=A0ABR0AEL1_9CRUS|nr:hypothetical protein OUZ56_008972 [Daphnia magna]
MEGENNEDENDGALDNYTPACEGSTVGDTLVRTFNRSMYETVRILSLSPRIICQKLLGQSAGESPQFSCPQSVVRLRILSWSTLDHSTTHHSPRIKCGRGLWTGETADFHLQTGPKFLTAVHSFSMGQQSAVHGLYGDAAFNIDMCIEFTLVKKDRQTEDRDEEKMIQCGTKHCKE